MKRHNCTLTTKESIAPFLAQPLSIIISDANHRQVYLSEIADIRIETSTDRTNVLKINGKASVGMFVRPVPGQNIKAMCDNILQIVEETLALESVPDDIAFSLSINPGEFISEATQNVMQEVWLCSLIAVLVLFIFIGSFAGTLTALIEIPTSILLSFIIMKIAGVQINLISLGGLALSVGMNVDASIVVIDNIIKKMSTLAGTKPSHGQIIQAVFEAVCEVVTPITVATLTSLVVFVPLTFTSELTNAILGDLAKAVIFSHGISLFIALILVPTIRIQMARYLGTFAEEHRISFIEMLLNGLYGIYTRLLSGLLGRKLLFYSLFLLFCAIFAYSLWFVPPKLKKEIIGQPDTAIIGTSISTSGKLHLVQMEDLVIKFERELKEDFGEKVAFTFANIHNPNHAFVAIHLKDKRDYSEVFERAQKLKKSSLEASYFFMPFNPSELPIPNPPDWKVKFTGADNEVILAAMDDFFFRLLDKKIFDNLNPDDSHPTNLVVEPYSHILENMRNHSIDIQTKDFSDLISLAHKPYYLGKLPIEGKLKRVVAKYPPKQLNSPYDLGNIPVPVQNRVLPLRALAALKEQPREPTMVRINGERVFSLSGRLSETEKPQEEQKLHALQKFVAEYNLDLEKAGSQVELALEDPKKDLNKALNELLVTISIAFFLILLLLYLQFSGLVHTLIIVLAIPFGILGVLWSLYAFDSTLSLNSALGIILLNGISVANSIMLVELILRYCQEGKSPKEAVLLTAKNRIRPILMTSLTTIFGMLPIALGFGEGGKVLQPLGIAVCGGLWVSLVFTLFMIPTFEYLYLTFLENKKQKRSSVG